MLRDLPPRQRATLEAIQGYWAELGVPPALADVAKALGVSRQTAYEHMKALRRKGLLDHIEGAGRTWRPTAPAGKRSCRVPIVGEVAAGSPIFAEKNIEGWITVDDVAPSDKLFALRIRGDSMVGAGILDGDLVVVRQQDTAYDGDIVVALVDDEDATVKKLRRQGGMIHLLAMNPSYDPIVVNGDSVCVQGRVVGVRRCLRDDEGGGNS